MQKGSVLFISPAFFGYETAICSAIRANGYDVDFYDERTSNNSFLKAVFRVKKSLLSYSINKYYHKILNQIKGNRYTHFLLIKGEVVPIWFIKEFRKLNPDAKLIYYTYDSFNNNNQNSLFILDQFDHCFSFDFEDVKLNPVFKLKHLFFTNEFLNHAENPARTYTAAFVGTLHSGRYAIVKQLFNKLENAYVFFYSPARWFFFLERLLNKTYKTIDISDVSFSKKDRKDVADVFKSSKCVLDIQRTGQTGLTMRTFEVLASGAILLTTNSYIKQTEFYDPSYIIICDPTNQLELDNCKKEIEQIVVPEKPLFNRSDDCYINNWVQEFLVVD
ncbi:hypothetical protein IM792_11935 [Mucilaginibacter sp. JRF]|uniref:glycosyltransferase family protein n=1 Tax=Mucilaginibacter sp. JRF TaxID=2780088 RepID=UPI0018811548|nr:hypothetical protein [Mucilaginibacter sp. JRF]MBE9585161.1 hypothetical protein [Mucilaginibacter sp. JRF]